MRRTGNGLIVTAVAHRRADRPIIERYRVVNSAAASASRPTAAAQVVVRGDIKQVINRPPIVVAEGNAALVFAGAVAAAVVGI